MKNVKVALAIIANLLFIQTSYATEKEDLDYTPVEKFKNDDRFKIYQLHSMLLDDSSKYPFGCTIDCSRTRKIAVKQVLDHTKEYIITALPQVIETFCVHVSNILPTFKDIKFFQQSSGNAGAKVFLLQDAQRNTRAAVKLFDKDRLEDWAVEVGNLTVAHALVTLNTPLQEVALRFPGILRPSVLKNDQKEIINLALTMGGAAGRDLRVYFEDYLQCGDIYTFNSIWRKTALILVQFHKSWTSQDKYGPINTVHNKTNLKNRKEAYEVYIGNQKTAFSNLFKNEDIKSIVSNNLEYLRKENFIEKVCYEELNSYFKSVFELHNKFNMSFEECDKSLNLTMTHGDLHIENVFYFFDGTVGGLTFIDYETMMKTYKLIGDPAEDIGRLIGSLWVSAAKQCCTGGIALESIFWKLKMWQEQFLGHYLSFGSSNKSIEDFLKNETRMKINTLFFMLKLFKVVLTNKKIVDTEQVRSKANLIYFIARDYENSKEWIERLKK